MAENISSLPTHGVLFKLCDTGVLLTGNSGLGKSDLVLQLIQWGAQLVCDDAPLFSVQDNNGKKQVIGSCNESFSGILYIRDLGLIDLCAVFEQDAIISQVPLQLIIQLSLQSDNFHPQTDLLSPEYKKLIYKQITIDSMDLPYNAHRPMALLVKTAIKQYVLKRRGVDRCEKLINKNYTYREQN